jgi:hypothetical protein
MGFLKSGFLSLVENSRTGAVGQRQLDNVKVLLIQLVAVHSNELFEIEPRLLVHNVEVAVLARITQANDRKHVSESQKKIDRSFEIGKSSYSTWCLEIPI